MTIDLTKGIVRILKPDGTTAGTGFVVSDEGLIATCAHVVRLARAGPSDNVRIVFHFSGEPALAQVEPEWLSQPEKQDVAVLRLADGKLPVNVVPLSLASSSLAQRGDVLRTFGFSYAMPVDGTEAKCEVAGTTTINSSPVLQIHSTSLTQGFSGAPLWSDQLGLAVGMVSTFLREDLFGKQFEDAFAIRTGTIRQVCDSLKLPQKEAYRGLEVFEAHHASLYFGRERVIREVMDTLSRHDISLLVGSSGCGKSSLVRAGLKTGFRKWSIPCWTDPERCVTTPDGSPMLSLILDLAQLPRLGAKQVVGAFGLSQNVLVPASEDRLAAAKILSTQDSKTIRTSIRACAPEQGLLLVVDQCEQLFTKPSKSEEGWRFVDALIAAAGDHVKLLLVVRIDCLGQILDAHAELGQAIDRGGWVRLNGMDESELREVIEKPANLLGRSLQPGLPDRLIRDLGDKRGTLPLLEFALTELWKEDNHKGVLTLSTYEKLCYEAPDGQRSSGVQGAIAQRAESIWRELDQQKQRAAQLVFLRLVNPGPLNEHEKQATVDTGRSAWQTEWDELSLQVLDKLVAARLLTTGQDPFSGEPTAEIAHDALIRAWPRLQRWVADYRPFLRWYSHDLAPSLQRWREKEEQRAYLLLGPGMPLARDWLHKASDLLAGPPADYIRASVREAERGRRQTTAGLTAGLLAALVLIALLAVQWKRAEAEANIAISRRLAIAAVSQTDLDTARSVLLAVEAVQTAHTFEAETALRRTLLASPTETTLDGHGEWLNSAEFSPDDQRVVTASFDGTACVWEVGTGDELMTLYGHKGSVSSAAFSPSGRWIVTTGGDRTVRLWDSTTGGELAVLSEHQHPVASAAFSHDEQWLVTIEQYPGTVAHVWDVAAILKDNEAMAAPVSTLHHEGNLISSVAFSPNGQNVLTAGYDGTARIWDAASGEELCILRGHEGELYSAAFSPDGQSVLTSSQDHTARVWKTKMGSEYRVLRGHITSVSKAIFSPDGLWAVTLTGDHETVVWDLLAGDKLHTLGGPRERVEMIAFHPDGSWMATVETMAGEEAGLPSMSRMVQIRDVMTGEKLLTLGKHDNSITSLTFSRSGQLLLSASYDGTARIWELNVLQETLRIQHDNSVRAVDFSPVDLKLASGSKGGEIQVWDIARGERIAQMRHEGGVRAIDFGPDGCQVLSGGDDKTVRIWNVDTEQEVRQMLHESWVSSVAFSPAGDRVASGSEDKTVRVWSATTGEELVSKRFKQAVGCLAFSPDGQWIVSGTRDGMVQVWQADSGREVAHIQHEGWVGAVAFSPNGRWIASASNRLTQQWTRGEVQIWEVDTEKTLLHLPFDHEIWSVSFSPNGEWVASGGEAHRVELWEATTGQEVAYLMHGGTVHALDFSTDGQWLVSAGSDNTARVWPWELEDWISEACARMPRNMTAQEWQIYSADEPCHPTCPNLPDRCTLLQASPSHTEAP